MKSNKLGILTIAFMYVGTIMGAGFASGREIWQFFGVFGGRGYIGVILVGVLFMGVGCMTSVIAQRLGTNDMGKVIVPGGHKHLIAVVGYFMAFMLTTVLVTMSAAGGALFQQQFGWSRVLGGAVVILFVVLTVIGGFDRVSRVFRFLMPVLACTVIGVCLLIIVRRFLAGELVSPAVKTTPSPLAPVWPVSALLYVSYNMLGIVPIVATASIHAKSGKRAIAGTALGGLFLAVLALVLVTAMRTDMALSQSMAMPMLAFSAGLAPWINGIYTAVLMFAIYASATSNYYGFTTKLRESSHKKQLIVLIAFAGFLLGLIGFKNVIAYLFPVEGFLGFGIVLLVVVNFMTVIKKEKSFFDVFGKQYDRFDLPEGMVRVTAGHGGEAILVLGSEKTALVDCGMAYCEEGLLQNIKKALGNRPLDFILLSHTHYDHIGALPYVRKQYPEAVVYGAEHGRDILNRRGALAVIQKLGKTARADYDPGSDLEIITEGLSIDVTVKEGDRISLGDSWFTVLETKGHTDCSLTYILEPSRFMFASESTGILEGPAYVHLPILKSYRDSISSIEKCRAYGPDYILLPHFGLLPQDFNKTFWELAVKCAEEKKAFLYEFYKAGLPEGEVLERYMDRYWVPGKAAEQPIEAFRMNAKNIIKAVMEEFEEG